MNIILLKWMRQRSISTAIIIALLMKRPRRQFQCDKAVLSKKICTVCAIVAADRIKGTVNGRIAKELPSIFPQGMYGSIQQKSWMDNRPMEICSEKVWELYVENVNNSVF